MERKHIWTAVSVFMVLGLLIGVLGCAGTTPTSTSPTGTAPATTTPATTAVSSPLKLGYVAPLSGAAALYGKGGVAGHSMGVDEINAKGGVLGRKIQLITRDDQGQPDIAVREMRSLILDEKVDIIMGPITSTSAIAMSALAKELKFPIVVDGAGATSLTTENGHRYIFRAKCNVYIQNNAMLQSIKDQGWKNVVYIASDNASGRAVLTDFKNLASKIIPGMTVTAELWPPFGEKDFSTYITRIVAAKPDAIYSGLYGNDVVAFIKQADAFGLIKQTPIAGITLDAESIRSLGNSFPEGVYGFSQYESLTPDTPENRDFAQKYYQRAGEWPGMGGAQSYSSTLFWAKAMEKAGTTTDRERIIDAMEGLTWLTPYGEVTMRKLDHQASIGVVVGRTAKVAQFPDFLVVTGKYIPGDQLWQTEEQVTVARQAVAK